MIFWQQIANSTVTAILTSHEDCEGVVLDCEHGEFGISDIRDCSLIDDSKQIYVRIAPPYAIAHQIAHIKGVSGIIFADTTTDNNFDFGCGLDSRNFWGQKDPKSVITIAQIERPSAIGISGYTYYMMTPIDFKKRSTNFEKESNEFLQTYDHTCRAEHIIFESQLRYKSAWKAYGIDAMMLLDGAKKYKRYASDT